MTFALSTSLSAQIAIRRGKALLAASRTCSEPQQLTASGPASSVPDSAGLEDMSEDSPPMQPECAAAVSIRLVEPTNPGAWAGRRTQSLGVAHGYVARGTRLG